MARVGATLKKALRNPHNADGIEAPAVDPFVRKAGCARKRKHGSSEKYTKVASPYHPGWLERAGNAVFDAARSVGLPAERMRRDIGAASAFARSGTDSAAFGFGEESRALASTLTPASAGVSGITLGNLRLQKDKSELARIQHPERDGYRRACGGRRHALRDGESRDNLD